MSYRTFRGDHAVTQSSLSGAADCPNYLRSESSFVLLHLPTPTAKCEHSTTALTTDTPQKLSMNTSVESQKTMETVSTSDSSFFVPGGAKLGDFAMQSEQKDVQFNNIFFL